MRVRALRAAAYLAAAAGVALALRFSPQLPERRPAELLIQQAATPSWAVRQDSLERGGNLRGVLRRAGLSDSDAAAALKAATGLDHRRLREGMQVSVRVEHPDSAPSEVVLHLTLEKHLKLARAGDEWVASEELLPWEVDTIVVGGQIRSNLYSAVDESARDLLPRTARDQLTWSLADVFEYRVDMSRDLQQGDAFKVIAERAQGPNGATRINRIIAATFSLSGSVLNAIRFDDTKAPGTYFDQDGKSLRAEFLRAPLEYRRISSAFGFRVHPILGDRRLHRGTDYAAAAGTPVRAIAHGTVIRAGWMNGYGNVVDIRHRNGWVTRYGHLQKFAPGIKQGVTVSIGQTIAAVGSTGLATGPHLHFELHVNGVQRDPRSELMRRTGGEPIPAEDRLAFMALRDQLLATLDVAEMGAQPLTTAAR